MSTRTPVGTPPSPLPNAGAGEGRGAVVPPEASVDGRSSRWAGHRAQRRDELVAATLRAVRMHGAGVGMDEIAATAGTSKTVFYRHFDGRAGLYRAVAEHVDAGLLAQVMGAARLRGAAGAGHRGIAGAAGAREVLREAVDTYLRLVEEDPQVYLFVVSAPLVPAREGGGRDVAADATDAMSGRIVGLLASFLEEAGQPSLRAQRWSRAVVGSVRSAGDDWLRAGASASGTERVELVDDLTTLLWDGLSGSLAQP